MLETTPPIRRNWKSAALAEFEDSALLRRDATMADLVSRSRSRLCYLATPYTKLAQHSDGGFCPTKSVEASVKAARWSRLLALEGVTAVSPIVQAVEMINADIINQQLDPLDEKFWELWCRPLLRASAVVIVPPIPGWDQSEGVWHEVRQALLSQVQVILIKPGQDRDSSIYLGVS
ncbi:DUF1937 family protein [Ruegeria arenilitoris]|uniref:DUF1937 family protein n=1 Tax=Ruegeria arenilitoris TaxID=1173585 RepID=UPI00147A0069|nr:DUF1937 family protein [Ruegeria arenilitoris]